MQGHALSHQVPRAAGTAAGAWDTRRPGSSRGRWRRASHRVGKRLGDSRERRPCRTQGGHSRLQPDGTAHPPASAIQGTHVVGERPRHIKTMDSEGSAPTARLRGRAARREDVVDPTAEQSQHRTRREDANQPGQTGGSTAPLGASRALTWQLAQQSPWEHWAPSRSEQLWAKQQRSGHSWGQKGERGPGEGAAAPRTPGRGGRGPALACGPRTSPGRRRSRTPRPPPRSRCRSAPAAPGAPRRAHWTGTRRPPCGGRRAAGDGCKR